MDERKIIEGAIKLLKEKGWHQGHYSGGRGELCAFGALSDSFFSLGHRWPQRWDRQENFDEDYRAFRRAGDMVLEAAGTELSLPSWNDEEGRTLDDVIDAMERAVRACP